MGDRAATANDPNEMLRIEDEAHRLFAHELAPGVIGVIQARRNGGARRMRLPFEVTIADHGAIEDGNTPLTCASDLDNPWSCLWRALLTGPVPRPDYEALLQERVAVATDRRAETATTRAAAIRLARQHRIRIPGLPRTDGRKGTPRARPVIPHLLLPGDSTPCREPGRRGLIVLPNDHDGRQWNALQKPGPTTGWAPSAGRRQGGSAICHAAEGKEFSPPLGMTAVLADNLNAWVCRHAKRLEFITFSAGSFQRFASRDTAPCVFDVVRRAGAVASAERRSRMRRKIDTPPEWRPLAEMLSDEKFGPDALLLAERRGIPLPVWQVGPGMVLVDRAVGRNWAELVRLEGIG